MAPGSPTCSSAVGSSLPVAGWAFAGFAPAAPVAVVSVSPVPVLFAGLALAGVDFADAALLGVVALPGGVDLLGGVASPGGVASAGGVERADLVAALLGAVLAEVVLAGVGAEGTADLACGRALAGLLPAGRLADASAGSAALAAGDLAGAGWAAAAADGFAGAESPDRGGLIFKTGGLAGGGATVDRYSAVLPLAGGAGGCAPAGDAGSGCAFAAEEAFVAEDVGFGGAAAGRGTEPVALAVDLERELTVGLEREEVGLGGTTARDGEADCGVEAGLGATVGAGSDSGSAPVGWFGTAAARLRRSDVAMRDLRWSATR